MRFTDYFCLLLLLVVVACQPADDPSKRLTPRGYTYFNHTLQGGRKASSGDYVFYRFYIRYQDDIVDHYNENDFIPRYPIPGPELVNSGVSPTLEVLMELSKGDSATLIVPVDSLPTLPKGMQKGDTLYYELVLTDIKTAAEFAEYEAHEMEQRTAQIAEQSKHVPDILPVLDSFVRMDQKQPETLTWEDMGDGIRVHYLSKGTKKQPKNNAVYFIDYIGMRRDGVVFDNSYEQGVARKFRFGQTVLAGLDKALLQIPKGSVFILYIPADQAYGAVGLEPVVPPNTDVYFHMKLRE